MLGRDGIGVMGQGMRSGRGTGNCKGATADRSGTGLGRGYRRGSPNFAAKPTVSRTQKELLQEQKERL